MKAMVITPICPHRTLFKPLVLPSNSRIHVEIVSGACDIVIDGEVVSSCENQVFVKEHEKRFLLLRKPELSFYQILKQKLNMFKELVEE